MAVPGGELERPPYDPARFPPTEAGFLAAVRAGSLEALDVLVARCVPFTTDLARTVAETNDRAFIRCPVNHGILKVVIGRPGNREAPESVAVVPRGLVRSG